MKMIKQKLNYVVIILFICSLSLFAEIKNEQELKKYLDEKESVFEDISVQMGIATWNIYSQEGKADTQVPRLRYLELFKDETLNNEINTWHKKLSQINDYELKKRVEVWYKVLLGATVDNDDEIFPLEDQLEKWLANEDSVNERPSEVELDALIKELMARRNNKAKTLGFKNYADFQFTLNGLNYEEFEKIIDKVDNATLPKFQELVNEVLANDNKTEINFVDVMKMVGVLYKNKAVSLTEKSENDSVITETFANIGIDYKSQPIRFVEKDIPFGGNGLAIKIPTDFRIVVKNNQPIYVLMHELGHGMQGVFTDINSPILKGYEWCAGNECSAFYEGMAETSAKFVQNNKWLNKYLGYDDQKIKTKDSLNIKYAAAYLRYQMAAILLEIELYKNLDADPEIIRDSLYKKYLFVDAKTRGKFRYQDNVTYVSYPVYLQNYFIADIISTQVHTHFKNVYGENYIFNKKVGEDLINYLYKSGELYSWSEKLKNLTNKDLDVEGFLRSYGF